MKNLPGYTDLFMSPVTGKIYTNSISLEPGFTLIGDKKGQAISTYKLIDLKIDVLWLEKMMNVLTKLPIVLTQKNVTQDDWFPNAQILAELTGDSRRMLKIDDNGVIEIATPMVDFLVFDNDGNLDLLNGRIINLSNPINPQEAATKDYVDTFGGNAELTATGEVTGYKAAGDTVINLKVGTQILRTNGGISFFNSNPLAISSSIRAVSELEGLWDESIRIGCFNSVSSASSNFIWMHLEGDSSGYATDFSLRIGGIITPGQKILNYNIQNDILSFLSTVSMNNKKITDLATPTNLYDATTKIYVDNLVGSIQPQQLTFLGAVTGFKPWYDDEVTLSIAASGVTAGSYTNLSATIGADGRITAASNGGSSIEITGDVVGVGSLGGPINTSFVSNPSFSGVGAMTIPSGSTLQRPANGIAKTRYNTTDSKIEYNNGSFWRSLATEVYVGENSIRNINGSSNVTSSIINVIPFDGSPPYKYSNLDLTQTGVSAGSYTNVNATVDSYGRITSMSNGSPSSSRSIMQGGVSVAYSSDIGTLSDHIKFNQVLFSQGGNISLDTSSAYSIAVNTASVGRITLLANKTYKLTGSVNFSQLNGATINEFNAVKWANATTNSFIGVGAIAPPASSSVNRSPGIGAVAYITTLVDTMVELRITFTTFSSIAATAGGLGGAFFTAEEM